MKNRKFTLLFGLFLMLMVWRPTIAAVQEKSRVSAAKITHPIKEKQEKITHAITDKNREDASQKKLTDQEILRKKHKKLTFNETLELLHLRR